MVGLTNITNTILTDQSIITIVTNMNDKRTQLIEAAIDLFSKEGFWNTSTARISKHAKVATGTLFNYFPSKEALIDEVYVQLKHELLIIIQSNAPTEKNVQLHFEYLWQTLISWGVKNPVRFLLLEQLRLSNLVSEKAQEQVAVEFQPLLDLMEAGLKDKVLAETSLDYLVCVMSSNVDAAVKYAINNKLEGESLSDFCNASFALLWNGISAE